MHVVPNADGNQIPGKVRRVQSATILLRRLLKSPRVVDAANDARGSAHLDTLTRQHKQLDYGRDRRRREITRRDYPRITRT